ncbi:7-deoxyloganetin glucosyltransferase-like [Punica granatum]|uniref:7-deoxyloganetin glucosyltransferase-like n=1 Tax=Punica granatum TaxID=22663 RepID=A0A6P8C619_PUNGR|nr:7-deoxyloganetin glucosyltransferase-like [Punica granatum]
MRLCDFPTFVRNTPADEVLYDLTIDAIKSGEEAVATVIHTFKALEQDVLNALSSLLRKQVYAIGPFSLLLEQIPEKERRAKNIHGNLWEENIECLQWLELKESGSVLYINFGSIAFLSPEQSTEFAMGIANSDHPFLWIIRPDLVSGDNAILAREFAKKTKGRGFMIEWCPQEEVLNRPSVGGFLTHCGWNSTIESLSAGVPMQCWPCFGDQHTNCRFVCNDWEIGLEINNDVKRDEVERLVREMMGGGEKGKKMKERVAERKKLAEEATALCDSSAKDLDRLVNDTLLK